jgi:hypothetical protein
LPGCTAVWWSCATAYDEQLAARVREIVDDGILADDDTLALWVDRGADRASAMPPK